MNNTFAVRLNNELAARGLTSSDVREDALRAFVLDVERHYSATLTAEEWDSAINNYSTTGTVIV